MKKTGFTLIELLAVIVILAIIALIAVPIILNIIDDSKKESLQRSVDLYIDTVQKAITKYQMTYPGFNPSRCEIEENGKKLKCGDDYIEIETKGQTPESGTIKINDNKITYCVDLDGMEYIMNKNGKKEPQPSTTLATGNDYKGYYADVDDDGEVDGIIYADLAQSSEAGAKWNNDTYGTYSYVAKTNLNEYVVSQNKYKGNAAFGEKEVVRLKKDKKNPRFYVMALNNFETDDYVGFYWYYKALDKMSTYEDDTKLEFGTGYDNTGKMIEIWNRNGQGVGSYIGATQMNKDMFKHIQTKYAEGWYIPSRGEWAAFADYMFQRTENSISISNYEGFGLNKYYWSSSQGGIGRAWYANFEDVGMGNGEVNNSARVRLGITF